MKHLICMLFTGFLFAANASSSTCPDTEAVRKAFKDNQANISSRKEFEFKDAQNTQWRVIPGVIQKSPSKAKSFTPAEILDLPITYDMHSSINATGCIATFYYTRSADESPSKRQSDFPMLTGVIKQAK